MPVAFRLLLPVAECAVIVGAVGLWFTLLSDAVRLYLCVVAGGVGACAACGVTWVYKNGILSLLPPATQRSLLHTYVVACTFMAHAPPATI